jgi:hypothetical protein
LTDEVTRRLGVYDRPAYHGSDQSDKRGHAVQRSALAQKIAEGLDDARLPRGEPAAILVGYDGGCQCDGCDSVIAPGQIDYKLQYAHDRSYRLHWDCYGVWDHLRWRRPAA